jgi:hypothetical protein
MKKVLDIRVVLAFRQFPVLAEGGHLGLRQLTTSHWPLATSTNN